MRTGIRVLLVALAILAVGLGCRSSRRGADARPEIALRGSDSHAASKRPVSAKTAKTDKPDKPKQPTNSVSSAVVRPGYVLAVSVQVEGKKEIQESDARVSEEGDVRLPLVGTVAVAGLSLAELREKVAELYRGYFINPQVDVDFVVDGKSGVSPWGTVTVLGRVKTPGQISLPPTGDMSVVAAIQAAGGFDTSADQGGVRISRAGPTGTQTRRVNLKTLGSKGYSAEDLMVRDGDVIFVPEWLF